MFALTVRRQLDDQRVIVGLGFIKVALDVFLLFVPKHLRPFTGAHKLFVVSLQPFDDAAILLGTHLTQLQDGGGSKVNHGVETTQQRGSLCGGLPW